MMNLLNQPSLKLIELPEQNLTVVELPALVRFQCLVRLPKTNRDYKKLHQEVSMKFISELMQTAGGIRRLTQAEKEGLEKLISSEVSSVSNLRNFNLVYFPSTVASPRLKVARIEPIIEQDKSNPMVFKSDFRLISEPYLIKDHEGKEGFNEVFLLAEGRRAQDFGKGKRVKFERLKAVPIWVGISESTKEF